MTRVPGTIVLAAAMFALACSGSGESRRDAAAERQPANSNATVGDASEPRGTGTGVDSEAAPAEGESPAAGEPGGADDSSPSEMETVNVYFPATDGEGLVSESRRVFKTPQPGDMAKQIVAALLEGPQAEGSLRAVPETTELRQLFVLDDGTAWADFSAGLRENLAGGSANEIFAVYAIVDSIVLNVPGIARVGILVDGRPVESLNGHVDLRRALPARRDLLAVPPPPAPPAE